ncbi:hypothetical protein M9Y10_029571 [Tritrichomonas musculus]|uniref:HNH nuclease domain-containing protein n=1 Tax=Tritrichomonas musculus TaxID=1915356 RepID=A0ABR2KMK2_9EUKA
MTEEQVIEFVTINEHPDYEILNQYPYTIRRKDNHYVVKECINKSNCYVSVNINSNKINKHQIIAKQFIPNPNNLPFVDHISRDRTDYHLSNLRWVSAKENSINVSSRNEVEYVFVDNIPDDAIVITHYDVNNKRRYFEENKYYYYYNEETKEDVFYQRITDNVYKIMHINIKKGGYKVIRTTDINNKKTTLYIRSFKYQYDLI